MQPGTRHSHCQLLSRRPENPLVVIMLIFTLNWLANAENVMPGLEVFLQNYTYLVRGRNVALLTNRTGVDRHGRRNIDLFVAHPNINLIKIFAPEHGFSGTVEAGRHVANTIDRKSGLPIVSLYGKNGYAPSWQMLRDVDAVIYDIQDVGVRTYTYIWTMIKTMQACARHGIIFIVLDRPNILSPRIIDGPLADPNLGSLLTLYPIPRAYGLTPGELARYINATFHLQCLLVIIPMQGYHYDTIYEETGLPWVSPSPNIPDLAAARAFAATGTIGELGIFHIGIGTNRPFQIVGTPDLDEQALAEYLNRARLPGITFHPFQCKAPPGTLYQGQTLHAVFLEITDPRQFRPATTELLILHTLVNHYPPTRNAIISRASRVDRALGTSDLRHLLLSGKPFAEISRYCALQATAFAHGSLRWRLYH
ncbi:MAG: DUF1343 domain-containing protein [Lentisphaerae bacterium]|nr:MAG: DUF1343 domain-containing protein [Lentisphaerota bacterium]